MANIFVVTGMSDTNPDRDTRCMGWFSSLEDAIDAVKNCDLHECLYNYIVIEETPPGISPWIAHEDWFRYTEQGFVSCDKPLELNKIVNFGIG